MSFSFGAAARFPFGSSGRFALERSINFRRGRCCGIQWNPRRGFSTADFIGHFGRTNDLLTHKPGFHTRGSYQGFVYGRIHLHSPQTEIPLVAFWGFRQIRWKGSRSKVEPFLAGAVLKEKLRGSQLSGTTFCALIFVLVALRGGHGMLWPLPREVAVTLPRVFDAVAKKRSGVSAVNMSSATRCHGRSQNISRGAVTVLSPGRVH